MYNSSGGIKLTDNCFHLLKETDHDRSIHLYLEQREVQLHVNICTASQRGSHMSTFLDVQLCTQFALGNESETDSETT